MKMTQAHNRRNQAYQLAKAVHSKMMLNGMNGIYTPLIVCGVAVTCADDCQSIINRFNKEFYFIDYATIDAAYAEYCGDLHQ